MTDTCVVCGGPREWLGDAELGRSESPWCANHVPAWLRTAPARAMTFTDYLEVEMQGVLQHQG